MGGWDQKGTLAAPLMAPHGGKPVTAAPLRRPHDGDPMTVARVVHNVVYDTMGLWNSEALFGGNGVPQTPKYHGVPPTPWVPPRGTPRQA